MPLPHATAAPARRRQRGLTMMEMMVVLIIAGMALALGFQTLGQWRRTDASFSALNAMTQRDHLTRQWLLDSLRGLMAVKEPAFKGDAQALSGASLNPVLATQGGGVSVRWQVQVEAAGVVLVMVEDGRELRLPLRNATSARFAYLAPDGKLHPQWPPALGVSELLPAAITLELVDADGHMRNWTSAIAGRQSPVPEFFDDDDY